MVNTARDFLIVANNSLHMHLRLSQKEQFEKNRGNWQFDW